MTRFTFVLPELARKAAGLILLLVAAAMMAGAEQKPNIVFIVIDDFGWRDLSCYGSSFYETPNMDRLAREGMRFTDAYAAYPRCVPSRYAMMTGKYPARQQGNSDGMKINEEITIARALKEGGYTTFFCGKWHLGAGDNAPDKKGFDLNVAGGAAGAPRSHFAPYNVSRRRSGESEKAPIYGFDDAPKNEYLTDRLTREFTGFLHSHTNGPFFAVLAHYAVHGPIEGKEEYAERYQKKAEKNPLSGPDWEKESAGETKLKQDHPVYAAMIQSVDEGIGRILKTLEERKFAENTVVVLTSDHGGLSSRGGTREIATSNRPLRAGKGHLYEGGIRVPLIVKWPRVTAPGSVTTVQVTGTDYYPTFLEMAGLPARKEQHLDGVSFVSLLKGESPKQSRTLYWHNPAPRPAQTGDLFSSALREGNFKLVDFYVEKRVELYDLSKDPGEHHNLMDSMPDKGNELFTKLNAWRTEVKAALPTKTARSP